MGNVRWRVIEVNNTNRLTNDNQFIEDRITAGRFIYVRFQVENIGVEPLQFSDVAIVDASGREFDTYQDEIFYIEDQFYCGFLDQLNPNLTKWCDKIFELPPGTSGLKLKVGDLELFGEEEALIDLSVSGESVPIPTPIPPTSTPTRVYSNSSAGGSTGGPAAKCNDGTYSYSQSRRGTCSNHGGVAVWY